jgi:hypothetical protein
MKCPPNLFIDAVVQDRKNVTIQVLILQRILHTAVKQLLAGIPLPLSSSLFPCVRLSFLFACLLTSRCASRGISRLLGVRSLNRLLSPGSLF